MGTTALLSGQGSLDNHLCQMEHPFQFQILNEFIIEGEVLLFESNSFRIFSFNSLIFSLADRRSDSFRKIPTWEVIRVFISSLRGNRVLLLSVQRFLQVRIEMLSNVLERCFD